MITFAIGSIYDDILGGECDDGVGEVVACEEPAEDGDCLLIASSALAVDQDDAVHGMGVSLKSPNSYVGPSLVHLLKVPVEELWWNFALH